MIRSSLYIRPACTGGNLSGFLNQDADSSAAAIPVKLNGVSNPIPPALAAFKNCRLVLYISTSIRHADCTRTFITELRCKYPGIDLGLVRSKTVSLISTNHQSIFHPRLEMARNVTGENDRVFPHKLPG